MFVFVHVQKSSNKAIPLPFYFVLAIESISGTKGSQSDATLSSPCCSYLTLHVDALNRAYSCPLSQINWKRVRNQPPHFVICFDDVSSRFFQCWHFELLLGIGAWENKVERVPYSHFEIHWIHSFFLSRTWLVLWFWFDFVRLHLHSIAFVFICTLFDFVWLCLCFHFLLGFNLCMFP